MVEAQTKKHLSNNLELMTCEPHFNSRYEFREFSFYPHSKLVLKVSLFGFYYLLNCYVINKLLSDSLYILVYETTNLSVIEQKGESQNGCSRKSTPNFSKNIHFLTTDTQTYVFRKIWRALFS